MELVLIDYQHGCNQAKQHAVTKLTYDTFFSLSTQIK